MNWLFAGEKKKLSTIDEQQQQHFEHDSSARKLAHSNENRIRGKKNANKKKTR